MTIYILVKKRGAPSEDYRIHSRLKKWRNRYHLRFADALRKSLGSKYVVMVAHPYGSTYSDENGKVKYLQKLEPSKIGILGKLESYKKIEE